MNHLHTITGWTDNDNEKYIYVIDGSLLKRHKICVRCIYIWNLGEITYSTESLYHILITTNLIQP